MPEQVSFDSEGFTLRGALYIPIHPQDSPKPAVCVSHGLPFTPKPVEEKGYATLARRFCSEGFLTLIFNYRGTVGSEGEFSLWNWVRDLFSAIAYLYSRKEVDRGRLVVVGFSLGAAVSAYCSAKDDRIRGVVLCSCPSGLTSLSLKSVDRFIKHAKKFKTLRGIDKPGFTDQWIRDFQEISPIKWVDKISPRPLLIIHGLGDRVIPISNAYDLYKRAEEPKHLVTLRGDHHLRENRKAVSSIIGWLKERFH